MTLDSGGDEIRTHETLAGLPVFKTGEEDTLTGDQVKGCENTADRLGVLLGAVKQIAPELATLIEAWPDLPQVVRVGIMAMIQSTAKLKSPIDTVDKARVSGGDEHATAS